jgi:NAD(P)-dependent dehydrogenase (short-subunit alcohol dehydrogenase family)
VQKNKLAIVAGVGPGNGLALARRFSAGGYSTALLARNGDNARRFAADVPGARGYSCDVGDPEAVAACFAAIEQEAGAADVLLFNAGSGVFKAFDEVTTADFENAWRVNALGAWLCSRAVLPQMYRRGAGSIVFIGATASVRGAKMTSAFAPAKAAQRSLAQSMAKSLGPRNIHVALIIVDGAVDLPRTRAAMPDKDAEFFVDPAGVAETAWFLTHQDRRAWSFEVEARPFGEIW